MGFFSVHSSSIFAIFDKIILRFLDLNSTEKKLISWFFSCPYPPPLFTNVQKIILCSPSKIFKSNSIYDFCNSSPPSCRTFRLLPMRYFLYFLVSKPQNVTLLVFFFQLPKPPQFSLLYRIGYLTPEQFIFCLPLPRFSPLQKLII